MCALCTAKLIKFLQNRLPRRKNIVNYSNQSFLTREMNFLDLFFVILQNIYPSTNHMKLLSAFLALLSLPLGAAAQYAVNYEGSITAGGGSGEFSPYYINALRHGLRRHTQTFKTQIVTKTFHAVRMLSHD